MKITTRSSLADVCFAVCTALHRSGCVAVLTGGSAATFYAQHRYQSLDADFVIAMNPNPREAAAALLALGFTERAGAYHHDQSSYTLKFLPGPLSVGGEIVTDYQTIRHRGSLLHALSRTDSVRDRLSAFYHWADRSSLRTALDVAIGGPIDLEKIERWSADEGAAGKFVEFGRRYARERRALRGRRT